MKYTLLFIFTVFFLNMSQSLLGQSEIKDKDAEIEKLRGENKQLREYIGSLRGGEGMPFPGGVDAGFTVLYLSIDNPVKIVTPGFLEKEISITFENGTYKKTETGWSVRPVSIDKETVITVFTTIDGELRTMFQRNFQVKPIPPPLAYTQLSDNEEITGDSRFSKDQLRSFKRLIAKSEDAPQFRFKVLSFSISYVDSGRTVIEKSKGDEFTERQRQILAGLEKGKAVYITNIIAIGPDNIERELPPIEIRIR
jgi:hypothetical protein